MGYGSTIPPVFNGDARALNTVYSSSNKTVLASYTLSMSVTATITGGESIQADAQIRPDSESAWETVASEKLDQSFTISLVTLALTNSEHRTMTFFVPKGYEYRVTTSGTGSISMLYSKEVEL